MSSGSPHFTYLPAPHERAYYGLLFQTADEERTGNIGGAQAVSFFMKSKVPIAILKDIWTAADQPPTNALNPQKFAVAIRLIQCEQNGIPFASIRAPDLLQGLPPNLRPAFFDGIAPPPGPQAVPPAAAPRPDAGSVAPSVTGPPPVSYPHQQQLALQDPYLLTPTEQSRYEQLFPEYTVQDPQKQFMQGSEAVTLFQKSGLSQAILAQIWNMVDSDPVDNQLDLVEFVLAMHLIVCISKKNLPVPAALPLSLKQFKQQQKQQHPPSHIVMNGGGGPPPPPAPAAQVPPPAAHMPQPPAMSMAPPPAEAVPTMMASPPRMTMASPAPASAFSGLPGPPPLAKTGGMSISDAFEGLDAVGGGSGGFGGSHFGGDTGSISSYRAATPPPAVVSPKITTIPEVPPSSYEMPASQAPKEFVASYDLGDSHVELKKLREALQKLQAENISLKATMGNLSSEEQEVQRELNATVAEVTKLSHDLTKIRAQVLASKSRLLEATAELKAAKEKTTVLKDLISDATATKQAMDEAHESIENANEVLARSAGVTGGGMAAPPAPVPETDFFGGWGDDDTGAVNAPLPGLSSGLYTAATSSADELSQPAYNAPAPVLSQPPAAANPPVSTFSYSANPDLTPSTNMYNGGGYTGGHNRDISGNDFGEVMGSGSGFQIPEPSTIPQYGSSGYGSSIGAPSTYDSIPHATSLKEVEDLKSKSKEADDLARDAESSRKQLVAQLEELRRLADEAESKVRAASDKPVKKKGILGRGGPQKKDQKEIDRLMMDARDKKEAMLQAQAQVKDAEALVIATKQEAERLNKQAEDAQMSAAAAASMQDQPKLMAPQPPQYGAPFGGQAGLPSMQVYDNPGTTGIDYSNPFE